MGKVPVKRIRCTICLREIRGSNMSRHKKTHERAYLNKSSNPKIRRVYNGLKKKSECPICKKKIHVQNIWDHVHNIHYKVKPYKCDHCNKYFSCKSNLNRHIKRRVHNKKDAIIIVSPKMNIAKKKECHICKKKIYAQNMGDHMKNIHYKVKPYKCDHCDKYFFCKSNLNRHIRRRIHNKKKDEPIIETEKCFQQ